MTAIPQVAWKVVTQDDKPTVKMCCPACGIWADLDGHTIASDGAVTPSVQCPNDGTLTRLAVRDDLSLRVERLGDRTTPCTFHDAVKLEGWPGESAKEGQP